MTDKNEFQGLLTKIEKLKISRGFLLTKDKRERCHLIVLLNPYKKVDNLLISYNRENVYADNNNSADYATITTLIC